MEDWALGQLPILKKLVINVTVITATDNVINIAVCYYSCSCCSYDNDNCHDSVKEECSNGNDKDNDKIKKQQ